MKLIKKRGSTSNIIRVFISDASSISGAGKTGLTNSSTNLYIVTRREKDTSSTTYSGSNIETISQPGTFAAPSSSSKVRFAAVDATYLPGVYELQFHDSAAEFSSNDTSGYVLIHIFEYSTSALNVVPCLAEVELVAYDTQSSVLGMTAIPTTGTIITAGTSTAQLNVSGGNVAGSVGSVTGSVGSVVGSVGSVTGLTKELIRAEIDSNSTKLDVAVSSRVPISQDLVAGISFLGPFDIDTNTLTVPNSSGTSKIFQFINQVAATGSFAIGGIGRNGSKLFVTGYDDTEYNFDMVQNIGDGDVGFIEVSILASMNNNDGDYARSTLDLSTMTGTLFVFDGITYDFSEGQNAVVAALTANLGQNYTITENSNIPSIIIEYTGAGHHSGVTDLGFTDIDSGITYSFTDGINDTYSDRTAEDVATFISGYLDGTSQFSSTVSGTTVSLTSTAPVATAGDGNKTITATNITAYARSILDFSGAAIGSFNFDSNVFTFNNDINTVADNISIYLTDAHGEGQYTVTNDHVTITVEYTGAGYNPPVTDLGFTNINCTDLVYTFIDADTNPAFMSLSGLSGGVSVGTNIPVITAGSTTTAKTNFISKVNSEAYSITALADTINTHRVNLYMNYSTEIPEITTNNNSCFVPRGFFDGFQYYVLPAPYTSTRNRLSDVIALTETRHDGVSGNGKVFYVDPTSTNTTEEGTKDNPFTNFWVAYDAITSGNGDTIILVGTNGGNLLDLNWTGGSDAGGGSGGIMAKSRFSIRGEGRGFIVGNSGGPRVFDISGSEIYLTGFSINHSYASSSASAIRINNGSNNVIDNIFFRGWKGTAITISGSVSKFNFVQNCLLNPALNAPSTTGLSTIYVSDSGAVQGPNVIRNNRIFGNTTGIGITLGANAHDIHVMNNLIRGHTTGIKLLATANNNHVVWNSVGNNSTADITDSSGVTSNVINNNYAVAQDAKVDAIKVKTDYLPSATAGSAGGVFIAGTNAATTVNLTGNLSGSVGSVSGSVGSVTNKVTPIDSDGTTYAKLAEMLLAFMSGKADITDNGSSINTISFKKADGTTESFSRSYNTDTGARP